MNDEDVVIDGKPLKDMKVAELKKACKDRNLPLGGNKATIIKRLKAVSSSGNFLPVNKNYQI